MNACAVGVILAVAFCLITVAFMGLVTACGPVETPPSCPTATHLLPSDPASGCT